MSVTAKLQRALIAMLVALVAAIVVVLVVGRGGSHSSAEATAASSQFDGPSMGGVAAKNFTLTDQRGKRITLDRDRGHVVVLTFIHSLCRDACPFMTEQIKGALNLLPGAGRGVDVIGVSVDPGQDTVRNRDRFLAQHEMTRRMAFVNGPRSAVSRVWRDYGIAPETRVSEHSAFVLLIDPRGRERVGFAADQLTPDALAHDIRVLQARRA